MGTSIKGCGMALPERSVTNRELAENLDVSDSWVQERTGIRSRYVSGPSETSSSLAIDACRAALKDAGRAPDDLDLIIVATMTPDSPLPSVSCMVQSALGASGAAAFDVNAACTGFLSALSIASAFIEQGAYGRVLVCGSDVLTKIADYTDPASCVLFGDGAGAVVLEQGPAAASGGEFTLYADGSKAELLFVGVDDGLIHMKGREVYRYAVEGMATAITTRLNRSGMTIRDVDLVVAHQANARILAAVAERLDLPGQKLIVDVEEMGNTSAASIPIALARAAETGRLQAGARVLLVAFGGGFTWGAGLIRWDASRRLPAPAMAGAAHE